MMLDFTTFSPLRWRRRRSIRRSNRSGADRGAAAVRSGVRFEGHQDAGRTRRGASPAIQHRGHRGWDAALMEYI